MTAEQPLSDLEAKILIAAGENESFSVPKDLEQRVAVIRLEERRLLRYSHLGSNERDVYVPTDRGYVRALQERDRRRRQA